MGENSSLTKCLVNIPGHNVGPEESCERAKNKGGKYVFFMKKCPILASNTAGQWILFNAWK